MNSYKLHDIIKTNVLTVVSGVSGCLCYCVCSPVIIYDSRTRKRTLSYKFTCQKDYSIS